MMLKKNKKFFIASCIVILLPMFAGFLLWDQLPAQVATHFGRNGEAFFGHPPYDQCHQKFQAAAQAAADNAHDARCAAAALWQPGRALKK